MVKSSSAVKLLKLRFSFPAFEGAVTFQKHEGAKGNGLGFGFAVPPEKNLNLVGAIDFECNDARGTVVTEQDLVLFKNKSQVFARVHHRSGVNNNKPAAEVIPGP